MCNNNVWSGVQPPASSMMINDFAILPDARTGHDPNWDAVVVGRVRSGMGAPRASVRDRDSNASRKKAPGVRDNINAMNRKSYTV